MNAIIISGPPKSGKSAIAAAVASLLASRGYRVVVDDEKQLATFGDQVDPGRQLRVLIATRTKGVAPVISPAEFETAMSEALEGGPEEGHSAADRLMCDTLASLGYGAGATAFQAAKKWYA